MSKVLEAVLLLLVLEYDKFKVLLEDTDDLSDEKQYGHIVEAIRKAILEIDYVVRLENLTPQTKENK